MSVKNAFIEQLLPTLLQDQCSGLDWTCDTVSGAQETSPSGSGVPRLAEGRVQKNKKKCVVFLASKCFEMC